MSLLSKSRLAYRAFFDPRMPGTAKFLIAVAILYGLSPIDLFPDFLPLLGQLDDLIIIALTVLQFMRRIPRTIANEEVSHRRAIIDV